MKEVPASARHPLDSGEPFSTRSRPLALEVARILGWAPASMGLRSLRVKQESQSSDGVKTVKCERSCGSPRWRRRRYNKCSGPRMEARATAQQNAWAPQKRWQEVQFEIARVLSLPRRLLHRVRLFLYDTAAQSLPVIRRMMRVARCSGSFRRRRRQRLAFALRLVSDLRVSECARVSDLLPYRYGEFGQAAAISGFAADARLPRHLAPLLLCEETGVRAGRKGRFLAAENSDRELENAASSI